MITKPAPEMKTVRVPTMMTPSEVAAIDDWLFSNRVRGRSEAIRRLVAIGLKASGAAAPAKPTKGMAIRASKRRPG
jgi:hypothetical protein